MKKTIIIIFIIFSTFVYSQQIYPLNTDAISLPNGSYLKDLEGELDPYVGIWKGSWEGKTLYIQFKKLKHINGNTTDPHYVYRDRILGERKVIEANGIISFDRISNFDNQNAEFNGINIKFSNPAQKQLYFVTDVCGKTADVDVTFLDNAKTQMRLNLIYRPSYINETCPYYDSIIQGNDYPINFPKDIVLTKQ